MSSVDKPARLTLKLRTPASTTPRVPSARVVVPVAPAPKRGGSADWADTHKSQMQADMDELAARSKPR